MREPVILRFYTKSRILMKTAVIHPKLYYAYILHIKIAQIWKPLNLFDLYTMHKITILCNCFVIFLIWKIKLTVQIIFDCFYALVF